MTTNYREQARRELNEWWRDNMLPAIKADIDRMISLGFTEIEAECLVMEALLDSTRGLRGV